MNPSSSTPPASRLTCWNDVLAAGHAYLPININVGTRRSYIAQSYANSLPSLVLVDPASLSNPRVTSRPWTTYGVGPNGGISSLSRRPFHCTKDYLLTQAKCRQIWITRFLAAQVLNIPEGEDDRVHHINGDRLDCRVCNLLTYAEAKRRGFDLTYVVDNGSTFAHFPDLTEARNDRARRLPELRYQFKTGRKPKVPLEVLKTLISEFTERANHPDRYTPYVNFAEIARVANQDLTGTDFKWTTAQVRLCLLGKSCRLPEVDYRKISTVLPNRITRLQRMREALEVRRQILI